MDSQMPMGSQHTLVLAKDCRIIISTLYIHRFGQEFGGLV